QPTPDVPWDLKRLVHLHRRAGFAATWGEIRRDLADGPTASIDRVLNGRSRIAGVPEGFEAASEEIGQAAEISQDPERLKAWWFYRILCSPDPLSERLTLMWHNHFATSNFKVNNLPVMRRQNQVFRRLGRAKFGELLSAVLHDPAVLVWLDAPSNRAGAPNENLARELMELFTLGAGSFTETDVKEAARALTGWSVSDAGFVFRPEWHDAGTKTILGQTGQWDGDDLVRILGAHVATSHRLAWRICHTFMGENVADSAAIELLAIRLRETELDLGSAIERVLRSKLFFSDQNIRTQVAGPVEFLSGAVHALERFDPPPSTLVLAEWSQRLGQDLFYPPNVGGWSDGRAWLSTRTVIARANFASALVRGELNLSPAPPDLWAIAHSAGRAKDIRDAISFFHELFTGEPAAKDVLDALYRACAQEAAHETDQLANAVALLLACPESQLA
ncbi:MAG TPA: DUF1800 domain-containing protein, partial [Tepidisphaeraceae bacterium]|nr:DUF1800 domain-containing protein [Tepidisphaeraceae bacterium]